MSNEQQQPAAAGARKREQIVSTNKQMMIYVAATAAIVTVCVMLSINFWQRISYQMRVNSEWGFTNESLDKSISSISKLRENVEALSANANVKSIQNMVDPDLEKWQVVFDVLPSSCDVLAVEYAFYDKIFKPSQLTAGIKDVMAVMDGGGCGAVISNVAATPTVATGDTSGAMRPQAVMMTISFELTNATDNDIKKALLSMEYSLHPITVQSIEIDVDESGARLAKIVAVTYFIPKAIWQPGEKTIPVDDSANATNSGEAAQ
ncbi:MAG: hypothetical protein LBQ11_02770 [Candidatus Nomurabacteria bacterium]|jgi:hypothetical protein|nr:hypothetical protein [Candidatus Nomurabacteria bacterium]